MDGVFSRSYLFPLSMKPLSFLIVIVDPPKPPALRAQGRPRETTGTRSPGVYAIGEVP